LQALRCIASDYTRGTDCKAVETGENDAFKIQQRDGSFARIFFSEVDEFGFQFVGVDLFDDDGEVFDEWMVGMDSPLYKKADIVKEAVLEIGCSI